MCTEIGQAVTKLHVSTRFLLHPFLAFVLIISVSTMGCNSLRLIAYEAIPIECGATVSTNITFMVSCRMDNRERRLSFTNIRDYDSKIKAEILLQFLLESDYRYHTIRTHDRYCRQAHESEHRPTNRRPL